MQDIDNCRTYETCVFMCVCILIANKYIYKKKCAGKGGWPKWTITSLPLFSACENKTKSRHAWKQTERLKCLHSYASIVQVFDVCGFTLIVHFTNFYGSTHFGIWKMIKDLTLSPSCFLSLSLSSQVLFFWLFIDCLNK